MSKYHNTYQRIYQEKYRFLDTVTQPLMLMGVSNSIQYVYVVIISEISEVVKCFL